MTIEEAYNNVCKGIEIPYKKETLETLKKLIYKDEKPKCYREVYENVKDDCADCCIEVDCAIADCDNYLILKALDNMIKKKPEDIRRWENDRLVCAKCPSCTSFINNDMRYCDFCGQALDWSDIQ